MRQLMVLFKEKPYLTY